MLLEKLITFFTSPFMVVFAKVFLIALIGLEFYICLMPVSGTPAFEHQDKIAHFLMHMANTLVAGVAFPKCRTFVFAVGVLFILGPVIEVMQYSTPDRSASIYHEFANLAGQIAALWISLGIIRPSLAYDAEHEVRLCNAMSPHRS